VDGVKLFADSLVTHEVLASETEFCKETAAPVPSEFTIYYATGRFQ
jgi:hypothetical protein